MKYFVVSYYPLEVGITETTILSNSFVTWSHIPVSCDQRHLQDPQNNQLSLYEGERQQCPLVGKHSEDPTTTTVSHRNINKKRKKEKIICP